MSKTTPKDLAKKRNDEKLLISEMIALYCRKQHHSPKENLCPECQQPFFPELEEDDDDEEDDEPKR